MTNYEYIKSMSKDELTKWLNTFPFEGYPWLDWFDDKYCKNCERMVGYVQEFDRNCSFAYCEAYGKCKFFPEQEEAPNDEEIVKLWLEAQV